MNFSLVLDQVFTTDTSLTYLGDKLKFNMDKGHYTGVILLDLQKSCLKLSTIAFWYQN